MKSMARIGGAAAKTKISMCFVRCCQLLQLPHPAAADDTTCLSLLLTGKLGLHLLRSTESFRRDLKNRH